MIGVNSVRNTEKKTIWIFNHYATNMFYSQIGRHHSYARYLVEGGYNVKIFCASSWHKGGENVISDGQLYTCNSVDGIEYVFIKARDYVGNGKGRILNIFDYYRNLMKIYKRFEKPDLIIGSSVHPLACVAAIKIAKKYKCKAITEIRDLWPASLIEYGVIKRNGLAAAVLSKLEKWMYRKADSVIMTWPGGRQYIHDRGWSRQIPDEKVYHLSNGVELSDFRKNASNNSDELDEDLKSKSKFKVVYTGTVGAVNNIGVLLKAAKVLKDRGDNRAQILIYGKGNELEKLTEQVKNEGLDNILFKGFVPRNVVPAVLSYADCTILHNTSTGLNKYGQSQNKFFEYLAAGKPILMTYSVGYSICKERNCGIELDEQTPEAIADGIEYFSKLSPEQYVLYSKNAKETAEMYDYKALSKKLIEIIEKTLVGNI